MSLDISRLATDMEARVDAITSAQDNSGAGASSYKHQYYLAIATAIVNEIQGHAQAVNVSTGTQTANIQ